MSIPQLGTSPLDDTQIHTLGELVSAALNERELDADKLAGLEAAMAQYTGPSVLTLRAKGASILDLWESEGPALETTLEKLADLRATLSEAPDSFEWIPSAHAHTYRLSNDRQWGACRSNIHRGYKTFELRIDGQVIRWSPYEVIKPNLRFRLLLDAWREENGDMSEEDLRARGTAVFYNTAQFVGCLGAEGEMNSGPEFLFRGRHLTEVSEINRKSVAELVERQGRYLLNHIEEDGRMHYLIFPGIGEDPSGNNNMIRQWMATIALCRFGHFNNRDREVYAKVEKNIRYNLRHYYHAEGSNGMIEWGNRVALGSVSLAAIALIEHPARASFARAERKLCNTVEAVWAADGSFICQLKPQIKEHGINFYPGESMLMWSYLLKEKDNRKLFDKFMKSFRYYRNHHLNGPNRQPAFVPWHTQALYNVWEITEDPELKDFIFLMSDWLIQEMQQWEGTKTPDTPGQFYSPKKPEYGTPHASSTGVYMEGLIDAWRLAKAVKDRRRQERYRVAMIRGIRSCMQQTFLRPVETVYCPEPDMIRGGTTTTVYNNRVRNDNVQHNMMAIMKILEFFEDAEFEHEPWSWTPPEGN